MSYTKKTREPRTVTFEVPCIEEPVTIPSIKDAPFKHIAEFQQGKPGDLFDWLPAELSVIIWEATVDEVSDFFEAWGSASDGRSAEDKAMASAFERLAATMFTKTTD